MEVVPGVSFRPSGRPIARGKLWNGGTPPNPGQREVPGTLPRQSWGATMVFRGSRGVGGETRWYMTPYPGVSPEAQMNHVGESEPVR
jgi:hypothetical protein